MMVAGVIWSDLALVPYLMVLLVSVAFLLLMRVHRIYRKMNRLSAAQWRDHLFICYAQWKVYSKMILFWMGILFLCLALLHPQWGQKKESIIQEGRDLLIALDISRSMLAQDLKPDRLTFAKERIEKLVKKLDAERVSLILFAGSAVVQCPLTTDTTSFNLFLKDVDASIVASGTTAIDQAIKKALEVFSRTPAKKTKLLALFTDGEDYSANLDLLKQQAQQEGMIIFTLGVGTPQGAPVPIINAQGVSMGYEKDAQGNAIISSLNESLLRDLARDVGGTYRRITSDESDIDELLERVRRFEKEQFGQREINQHEEQYPYFLVVSLICFLVEWMV
ncbi:MAG: VWA domain-containing protein [Candidatus Babeliales bacterium]